MSLVPGKDWNNQQNIYHRWLKGETKAQREKIQKLIPAVLAILPRELRHRLCIFDTLERRALLAAQEALSTAIDAHDDAVQAVYRKAHFSGGGSPGDSVVVHWLKLIVPDCFVRYQLNVTLRALQGENKWLQTG